MPVSTTNKERYNALMTNLVTTRYDLDAREEAARKSTRASQTDSISMGADRSGLPVIIARSSYDVLLASFAKHSASYGLLRLKNVVSLKVL